MDTGQPVLKTTNQPLLVDTADRDDDCDDDDDADDTDDADDKDCWDSKSEMPDIYDAGICTSEFWSSSEFKLCKWENPQRWMRG